MKLTHTENYIYNLVVDSGDSVVELAQKTRRSEASVREHLSNIYIKKGVPSRIKLIVKHYKELINDNTKHVDA